MREITENRPNQFWMTFFYNAFLWVPSATKPGLLALLMTLLRATAYGFLFNIILVLCGLKYDAVGRSATWMIFVGFEELSRYSFLHKAKNLTRAGIIFFCSYVLIETVSYYKPPATLEHYMLLRLPSVLVHLFATAVMAWSITKPKFRIPVFVLIVGAHAAFDTWASYITL